MLDRFAWLVEGLVVHPDRMRENLDVEPRPLLQPASCCSRSWSRACRATTPTRSCSGGRWRPGTSGRDFRELVRADPEIAGRVDLDAVFDLTAYTRHVDVVFDRLAALKETAVHA